MRSGRAECALRAVLIVGLCLSVATIVVGVMVCVIPGTAWMDKTHRYTLVQMCLNTISSLRYPSRLATIAACIGSIADGDAATRLSLRGLLVASVGLAGVLASTIGFVAHLGWARRRFLRDLGYITVQGDEARPLLAPTAFRPGATGSAAS